MPVKAGRDYPVEIKLGAPVSPLIANNDAPYANDLTPNLNPDPSLTHSYESSSPVYKKPWFWVVIAVGVAAIATTTSVVVYAKSPNPQLSQQQICGRDCDACINCAVR